MILLARPAGFDNTPIHADMTQGSTIDGPFLALRLAENTCINLNLITRSKSPKLSASRCPAQEVRLMVSSPACIHFANYRFSSDNIQTAESTHRPPPSPFCRKESVASGQYVTMFRHEFPGATRTRCFLEMFSAPLVIRTPLVSFADPCLWAVVASK